MLLARTHPLWLRLVWVLWPSLIAAWLIWSVTGHGGQPNTYIILAPVQWFIVVLAYAIGPPSLLTWLYRRATRKREGETT